MKKNDQSRMAYSNGQSVGASRPTPPVAGRQAVSLGRKLPDPSSVLRSDRYPIPSSFEYRMRPQ